MKFVCCGDWHLRATVPSSRTDDFLEAQRRKIQQIGEIAVEEDAVGILQPGDFFDTVKSPYWLVSLYMEELRLISTSTNPIFTVYGQHDQRYHSNRIENTPLHLLTLAGRVSILGSSPVQWESNDSEPYVVHVYGKSWNEDIPEPEQYQPKAFNVLVLHQMVLNTEKIWEGQDDHTWGRTLLDTTDYDLIVAGDNHDQFVIHKGGKVLINAGSLMRATTAQMEHEPAVYVVDTDDLDSVKRVPLDIEPPRKVFDMDAIEERKESSKEVTAFIEKITGTELGGLDYLKNVDQVMDTNEVTADVRKEVHGIIASVRDS